MAERKRRINLYLALCMVFVLLSFVAIFPFFAKDNTGVKQTVSVKTSQSRYVLKLHNGKIAIFKDGNEMPEIITDISEHSLRNYDREQLKKGVLADGDMELAMLLEDYGS